MFPTSNRETHSVYGKSLYELLLRWFIYNMIGGKNTVKNEFIACIADILQGK